AWYVLTDVMGGSMPSRLFQEIRERQGLAYSVHSGSQSYRDAGLLYIYAGTDADNVDKVIKAVVKEVRALLKESLTPDELRRAKDHLKGSLILSLESTSSRMNRLARQELRFGSFLSMGAMLSAIDSVRPADVEERIRGVRDLHPLSPP